MTSQAERMASLSPVDQRPEIGGRDAFAEMFDEHARHLFDYCSGLLGDRARAASATQITLIAGHSLAGRLQDPSRMRAWLLALARWECLTGNRRGSRAGSTLPSRATGEFAEALAFVDTADDDVAGEASAELRRSDGDPAGGGWVRAVLDALPRGDREIIDLVYRHAVSLADLPAVLAIPASDTPRMLAAARAKFEKALAAAGHGPSADDPLGDGPHWTDATAVDDPADRSVHWGDAATARQVMSPAYRLAAVPLANLPASVWRRTARVVMDPKFRAYREAVSAHAEHLRPDGFPVQAEVARPPSGRRLLMASALLAGLLLAPPAAGAAGYVVLIGLQSASSAPGHGPAVAPGSSVSGSPAGSGLARSSGHARQSGSKRPGSKAARKHSGGATPRPGTSAPGTRRHSASPSPTSKFSPPTTPKPSPSSSSSSSSPSPSTSSPSPSPSSPTTTP